VIALDWFVLDPCVLDLFALDRFALVSVCIRSWSVCTSSSAS